MKKTLLKLIFLLSFFIGNTQSLTLIDLGKNYKSTNFGPMLNHNNSVDGYYNFSTGKNLKKGKREFLIKIYDEDLNLVLQKKYIDSKRLKFIDAKYNQQHIMLSFFDAKEKQFKLIEVTKNGEQKETKIIQLEFKEYGHNNRMIKLNRFPELIPIENKGFAFKYFTKKKKTGYKIAFYPTNGGEKWTYESDVKSKHHEDIAIAGVSEKAISFYIISRKLASSRKFTITTSIVNTTTGKLILQSVNNKNAPKILTNTHFEKDYFVNTGEYFSSGKNILKDASSGIYFNKYDYTGKSLSKKEISWNNKVFGKFQKTENKKNRNYLYVHEIVKTENDNYYVIAEAYKKSASATGIVANVGLLAIAAASGGGVGVQLGSFTKLSITDSYFIKLDKNFNLVEMTTLTKGKSNFQSPSDFGSAQINAHVLKAYGAFDYSYTQKDPEKDRFYSIFVDYERIKKGKNKFALKSIIHNNGKLTEDKIYLSNGKITTSVYPAKKGYVLLFDYNKRKKTATLHLEKLNIE
jgi:hypothetical protein